MPAEGGHVYSVQREIGRLYSYREGQAPAELGCVVLKLKIRAWNREHGWRGFGFNFNSNAGIVAPRVP